MCCVEVETVMKDCSHFRSALPEPVSGDLFTHRPSVGSGLLACVLSLFHTIVIWNYSLHMVFFFPVDKS